MFYYPSRANRAYLGVTHIVTIATAVQVGLEVHQCLAEVAHLRFLLIHEEQRIAQRRPLAHTSGILLLNGFDTINDGY